jgi:hypothetical protein
VNIHTNLLKKSPSILIPSPLLKCYQNKSGKISVDNVCIENGGRGERRGI